MRSKNKFFNEILELFIRAHYFNYNFLISSFNDPDYSDIFNHFFTQINETQQTQIEKYEFFGNNITTDEIREIGTLINNVNLHRYYKFIIIHDVEKILQNSMNALLKTIEEPNSPTIFFFTTQKIYNILPTIKSRCFQINLNYLERIYHDVSNINNTKNQIKTPLKNDVNINLSRQQNKNTKEEEIIESCIENDFIKLLQHNKPIHKTLKNYEQRIKAIKDFHCNKRHLLNKTLMKLKSAVIIR